VHLVRAVNGLSPFRAFLASYAGQRPGISHELVLLFKGFASERDADPYMALAAGLDARTMFIGDEGLDLSAYQLAAERLGRDHYCFLNSFSTILAPDWLSHLYRAVQAPGVGLVGATGSWGSIRSYQRFMLGFGGPYGRVFPERRATVATLEALVAGERAPALESQRGTTVPVISFARALLGQARGFAPFPAPHIRTNAFMISGELIAELALPAMRDKNDTYRLESGRRSITARVARLCLAARVVGRDGVSYSPSDWPGSRTFWQGEQENLLIADRQTAYYTRGSRAEREVLAGFAWGDRAEGGPAGRSQP
jgi:hypothetical protein